MSTYYGDPIDRTAPELIFGVAGIGYDFRTFDQIVVSESRPEDAERMRKLVAKRMGIEVPEDIVVENESQGKGRVKHI